MESNANGTNFQQVDVDVSDMFFSTGVEAEN